jgi:hypothetical protein
MNQERIASHSQSELNNCGESWRASTAHAEAGARRRQGAAALTAGELVHLPFDPRARHSSPFTYPETARARARLIPHTHTPNWMPFLYFLSLSLSRSIPAGVCTFLKGVLDICGLKFLRSLYNY